MKKRIVIEKGNEGYCCYILRAEPQETTFEPYLADDGKHKVFPALSDVRAWIEMEVARRALKGTWKDEAFHVE